MPDYTLDMSATRPLTGRKLSPKEIAHRCHLVGTDLKPQPASFTPWGQLCVSMGKIDLLSTLRVAQLVDNVHRREMALYSWISCPW